MATDVIKTIGATSSPTVPDYATLALWEADLPADLVSADERHIGECLNQGEFTGATTLLTIAGQTTDATRNIILRCATGASFTEHADVRTNPLFYDASKGVAITSSVLYSATIVVGTAYTNVRGLQVKSTHGNNISGVLRFTAGNGFVDDCLACNIASGGRQAAFIMSAADNFVVRNCIGILYGVQGSVFHVSVGSNAEFYGCTSIGNNTGTPGTGSNFAVSYGTITIKNCAGFGATTFKGGSASDSGSGFNATDLASAFGSNNQTSLTFADQFEDSTNDFRAVSTGDLQAGTPDATNTPDDITGLTRDATTPWIGCWEVAGGGGSFTMPADPGSYAITGTVASLEQGYVIGADTGSFSISGVAANLNQGYEVAAVPGEYLVSGVDANFILGFGFSADAGSYSITGTATTLLVANLLNAEVGSYLVSGVAANLEQGYLLQVGDPTSAGPNLGTGSNDSSTGTHAWTNPEEIGADDGFYAEAMSSASALNTQWLKILNPGFALPSDSSIVGIEVTVDALTIPSGTNPTIFLRLVIDGVISGEEKSGVFTLGEITYGSPTDLWTLSLTPGDINSATFGAVIRVTAGTSLFNDADIDYISVTVYYRDNAGVYSVTGTDANFIEGFGLTADVGNYLITGVSANLLQHSVLNAAVGSYVITGVAVTLSENLENIVGGRFVAGQVYYPGFVNAEIFYPGFKQAQVNN